MPENNDERTEYCRLLSAALANELAAGSDHEAIARLAPNKTTRQRLMQAAKDEDKHHRWISEMLRIHCGGVPQREGDDNARDNT